MKNILLPTDFSENSWNAIIYAIHFFKHLKCNFYLLHVNTPIYIETSEDSMPIYKNDINTLYVNNIKQRLRQLLKQISKLDTNYKDQNFYTLIETNFFINGTRNTLEQKHIDYIVMGTKGATGLEKLILGSNTADVITKVKCNTLIIPENASYVIPKEIALPTDFSLSHDLQVLQPIAKILDQFKGTLRILHINKNKVELNNEQQQNKELLEDFFNRHLYSFHYLTNKNIEDAIQCFIESRDINMVCMVAKNLNYFQQILFHSKVEHISYHTDIPFLVLHEKNENYG